METADFLRICESYLSDNLFRICVRICSGFAGSGRCCCDGSNCARYAAWNFTYVAAPVCHDHLDENHVSVTMHVSKIELSGKERLFVL